MQTSLGFLESLQDNVPQLHYILFLPILWQNSVQQALRPFQNQLLDKLM